MRSIVSSLALAMLVTTGSVVAQPSEARVLRTHVTLGGAVLVPPGGARLEPLFGVWIEPLPRQGVGMTLSALLAPGALGAGMLAGLSDVTLAYAHPVGGSSLLVTRAGLALAGGVGVHGMAAVPGLGLGVGWIIGTERPSLRLDYSLRTFGSLDRPTEGLFHAVGLGITVGPSRKAARGSPGGRPAGRAR